MAPNFLFHKSGPAKKQHTNHHSYVTMQTDYLHVLQHGCDFLADAGSKHLSGRLRITVEWNVSAGIGCDVNELDSLLAESKSKLRVSFTKLVNYTTWVDRLKLTFAHTWHCGQQAVVFKVYSNSIACFTSGVFYLRKTIIYFISPFRENNNVVLFPIPLHIFKLLANLWFICL